MSMLGCRIVVILFALLLASNGRADDARPAPADIDRAEQLFQDGKARMFDGDYANACPLLSESFRLDPATGSLLALALCQERAGQLDAAHQTYLDVAARARQGGDAERERAARGRARELAERREATEPPPEARPLESSSRAPSPTTSPAPRTHADVPRRASPARKAGVALLGAASASVVVGAYFALRSTVRNRHADLACTQDGCPPEALEDRDAAHTAKDAAIISFIAGGTLGAAGVISYLAGRSRSAPGRAAQGAAPWASTRGGGLLLRRAF